MKKHSIGLTRRTTFMLGAAITAIPTLANARPKWVHGETLDTIVKQEMAKRKIPGLALAVSRYGKPVYISTYGSADLELDVPVKKTHIFQSGSTGKMFTATAIMQLVQRGKLKLSDPISKFFKPTPKLWKDITVEHLMRHRSGITDYDGPKFDLRRDWKDDEIIEVFGTWPLEFTPGTQFSYSNSGYVLLGMIIGKVSGEFYGKYLQKNVFGPAGMKTAQVNDIMDVIPGRVRGYDLNTNGDYTRPIYVSIPLSRTGDGSLLYSIEDLIAWDTALTAGKILPTELQTLIETSPPFPDGTKAVDRYGAGWGSRDIRGRRLISHGGVWQGFSSWIGRYVDDDISIMILCNLEGGNPGGFADRLAATMAPVLRPYIPISDTNPKQTKRDRKTLESHLNAATATTAQQKRDQLELGKFSENDSFALVEVKDGQRTYLFGEGQGWLLAKFNASGKILDFEIT